jgi:hypothetical protein
MHMAVTKSKTGEAVKNNGGTLINAGTPASDSPITKVLGVNDINPAVDTGYGSKLVVNTATGNGTSDPHGVGKALSSGTFAYTPPAGTEFLLRQGGSTNAGKINGTASTVLTSPSSVTPVTIHKLTSTRRIGLYSNTVFNKLARPSTSVVPGRTRGTGAGNLSSFVQAADGTTTTGVDGGGSPTRSVPGELTYMFGGKLPKNDNYKAMDSHE